MLSGGGYFWWRNELESSELPALEQRVAGHLSVDAKGTVRLDLHGVLPGRDPMQSILGVPVASDCVICGVLKAGTTFVTLFGLSAAGGQAGGFSYESFTAAECLVSRALPGELRFSKLVIPLNGFEAWSSPGRVYCEKEEPNQLQVTFDKSKGHVYFFERGSLEVAHDFGGHLPGPSTLVCDVKLTSAFVVRFNSAASLEEVLDCYRSLQDLLLVLTGSSRLLDWPRLEQVADGGVTSLNFYFRRFGVPEGELAWFDSWTSYPRLRAIFGRMLRSWFNARNSLGPGIYLFLGTKREIPLYAEHRFVNLVWGLEAFHRRKSGNQEGDNARLRDKISRIKAVVAGCIGLNSRDRRWLNTVIDRQLGEPALETRLGDIFCWLCLGLDEEKIRGFAKKCADLRNDLSHFGGERSVGDYDVFISDIQKRTGALTVLYHLAILKTLGLEGDALKWIAYQRPGAGANVGVLAEAGLITRDQYREMVGARPSKGGKGY